MSQMRGQVSLLIPRPATSGIRRICLKWPKQVALTVDTCFSRLKSDDNVTPSRLSRRTCSLAAMMSAPSLMVRAHIPNLDRLCLEPHQLSSVLSIMSLRRLADIQWFTSVITCSSRPTADAESSQRQRRYNCDWATVWWKFHNPNFNRFSMIHPSDRQTDGRTDLNLYCIKGALALFVLVSFSGYVC